MKCESCHKEINAEDNICPFCKQTVQTKLKNKKSEKKGIVIAFAVISVAIIVSLGVFGYIIFQPGHLSQSTKTLEAGSIFNPLSLVALIGKDAEKYTLKVTENSININIPGEYTIIYTLTNNYTNRSNDLTFKIKVVDNTPPEIEADDLIYVSFGEKFNIFSFINVTDAVDGVIDTKNISIEGTVDVKKIGTYRLILFVFDKAGNKAEKAVSVIVEDSAPPKIEAADEIKAAFGKEFDILSFVTVTDAVDGVIDTKKINVEGTVDVNKAGTYQLIIYISDSAGNKTEKTISVIIEDTGDPAAFFDSINGVWQEIDGAMMYEFLIKNGEFFLIEYHWSPMGYQEDSAGVLTFINVNGHNTVATMSWDEALIYDDGSMDPETEQYPLLVDTGASNDNIITIAIDYGLGFNELSGEYILVN